MHIIILAAATIIGAYCHSVIIPVTDVIVVNLYNMACGLVNLCV